MSEGPGVSIRRSVVTMIAAALVGAGALTGCSDDEPETYDSGLPSKSEATESTEPTPTETSAPTPSQPSATGPQEPPLPDAAKAPGKKGARAFVAYYIKLLNYASWTGETKALRGYGPRCGGCKDYAKLFESTYGNGGWFKRGAWAPDSRTWFLTPSGNGFS